MLALTLRREIPAMPVDPAVSAVIGSAVTAIGLYFKREYDLRKIRTEERTADASAAKSEAEAAKADADIDAQQARTLLEGLKENAAASREWMQKYSEVLSRVGELTGKVGTLELHVERLETRVAELTQAKTAAEKAAADARKENAHLRRENSRLTTEVTRITIELSTAMDGFQGAMILLEGLAANDMGLSNIADDRIKRAVELETKWREKDRERAVHQQQRAREAKESQP